MAKEGNKVGRPSVITPEVLAKLEQVFAIDGTVEEACSYAEISRDAFYDYLKKEPTFSDRIADLRQRPLLKARQTIVKSLDDPNHAFKYAEKKLKKEFGNAIDITTGGDKFETFNEKQAELIARRILDDSSSSAKASD